MKHTPYGYDIVGGAAVINEEQAAAIRQTCENYLYGMSMTQAVGAAGINATYSVVKKLMLNPRYLGDEFYPAIRLSRPIRLWKRNGRDDMIAFLDEMPTMLTEYSDAITRRLVEKIMIYDEKIVVELKSGLQMEVEA